MPSTLFTSFMKIKRSKQHQTGTGSDNSAVVKAAAWAWYQHGLGSEGKPMREYDVTRIHHSPTPSRYRLEAIRIAKRESSEGSLTSTPASSIHMDIGSELLDTYEIESISKKLEGLIIESSSGDNKERKKKKNKLMMMQRGLSHHAVVCGTREEDVVESTTRAVKRVVPVVRMANCRPRATHAG